MRPFMRLTRAGVGRRRGATPPAANERLIRAYGVNGTGRYCLPCGAITYGLSERCGRCGA